MFLKRSALPGSCTPNYGASGALTSLTAPTHLHLPQRFFRKGVGMGEEEREYSIINSQKLNLTAYHVKMYLEEIQVLSFRLSDFIGWQLRCYIGVYRCCLKFSKKLTLTLSRGHWCHSGAAQFRPGHWKLGLRPLPQDLCLLSPKGNMGEGGLPDLFPVLRNYLLV